MSRILLVGKGAPDRGGIPSFLDSLRYGELAAEHQLTFLNVAHSDTPQGGRTTLANVTRTLRDTLSVWRASRGHDIVHVHSALAPAVTVLRAGAMTTGRWSTVLVAVAVAVLVNAPGAPMVSAHE